MRSGSPAQPGDDPMRNACWVTLLGVGALAVAPLLTGANADDKKDNGKGVVIEFGDLKSKTPADWKEQEIPEKARGLGRIYQFSLPKKGEDKDDAELFVFYFKGSGGDAKSNIERWKG